MKTDEEKQEDPLDARKFYLTAHINLFKWVLEDDVTELFTQRDLRLILKHVEGRSKYLTDKIKGFIERVDNETKQKTDWNSHVPKTSTVTLCND